MAWLDSVLTLPGTPIPVASTPVGRAYRQACRVVLAAASMHMLHALQHDQQQQCRRVVLPQQNGSMRVGKVLLLQTVITQCAVCTAGYMWWYLLRTHAGHQRVKA